MFSFISLFLPKKSPPTVDAQPPIQIDFFYLIAQKEKGLFFENFNLFYQETQTIIDLLLFIPSRGIYFGESLTWDFKTLQGTCVERSSQQNKSSTHLEKTHSAIHEKLEDILSFDSTVCERFFWMSHLREEEFDTLDPSFHTLLPKERLIFSDSSKESIYQKFDTLAPELNEPYSTLKIMGSLQSHTLILPSDENPYGDFLCDEQLDFLKTDYANTVTTLFGEHNSGKSTAIIRKALLHLLLYPKEKVLIITPTLIGGEILRNELISLVEYGALKIELSSLHFYTPHESEKIEDMECFQSASIILCDDAHMLEKSFIDTLLAERNKRWLLLSMYNNYMPISDSSLIFYNHYQKNITYKKIPCPAKQLLHTLLLELRLHLFSTSSNKIMVICDDEIKLHDFKEAIDEYFEVNCRIVNKAFSLQYQNLDDLILTPSENTYGLHLPHVFLIVSDEEENYTYALSRASESATIISFSNPQGGDNDQNYEE